MINIDSFSISKKNIINILKELSEVFLINSQEEYDSSFRKIQKEISLHLDYNNLLTTSSGTSALQLSLIASGIKKDDEVIIPQYTYIATALSVLNIGAIPVLAKVKEDLTIDPKDILNKISNKTKCIIPVHIHGNICEIEEIYKICKNNKLILIEDCSQSHGGYFKLKEKDKNVNVGSFNLGCFSMHTSKNLSGFGNSGMIACKNRLIFEKIKTLQSPEKCLEINSFSNLTPSKANLIQLVIIRENLKSFKNLIQRKRNIAKLYDKLIINTKIKKMSLNLANYNTYRDYCVEVDSFKDLIKLKNFLKENKIDTKIRNYNLNENKHLVNLVSGVSKTNELKSRYILCLPSHKEIGIKEVKYISDKINEYSGSLD